MLDVGEWSGHVGIGVDAQHLDVLVTFVGSPHVCVFGASRLEIFLLKYFSDQKAKTREKKNLKYNKNLLICREMKCHWLN